jgi:hypothetical protein
LYYGKTFHHDILEVGSHLLEVIFRHIEAAVMMKTKLKKMAKENCGKDTIPDVDV